MAVRKKRIEGLAAEILRENRITEPPVPVEDIVRKYGIQIRLQPLNSSISGFLFRANNNVVIGVNSFHPTVRQRFTLAHELGHFLLHQNDRLHVDRSVFAKLRTSNSSKSNDIDEIEANYFAAELLMPKEFVINDIEQSKIIDVLDDESIADLAKRYNVSNQAIVLRLTNLSYIEQ